MAGIAAALSSPALVRADSLEYVPRLPSLIWRDRTIILHEPLILDGYRNVVIDNCIIEASDRIGWRDTVVFGRNCKSVTLTRNLFLRATAGEHFHYAARAV